MLFLFTKASSGPIPDSGHFYPSEIDCSSAANSHLNHLLCRGEQINQLIPGT